MSFYSQTGNRPLGKGRQFPAGSVTDPNLSKMLANYKRTIASRYRSVAPDETEYLPEGGMYVSPKIDGHMWFLVFDGGEPHLVNPKGRVLVGDLPLLAEARTFASRITTPRAVFAGELFAVRKGGRPRFDGIAEALGGEASAPVGKLGWAGFDVVDVPDTEGGSQTAPYGERLELLNKVFEGGKRIRAIKTEQVSKHADVKRLFGEWVEGGKGEGLVIRTRDGRTWKMKPIFTLDAAVIGYTERADAPDQTRSVLLALMREDGQFQLIGSCGNLGNDAARSDLLQTLEPTLCPSNYRFAARSGELYRFVKPTIVMEIRVTDLQVENASGRAVNRMVLKYDDAGWGAVRPLPGISLIHPVLSRIRDDKTVTQVDVRAAQVLERVPVADVTVKANPIERPSSTLLRREVYVKATKGVRSVRKLLVWKTNKEQSDANWPAYVTTFVDYSPSRSAPLKREVRLSPSEEEAMSIAETMLAKGVKRGWNRVDAPA